MARPPPELQFVIDQFILSGVTNQNICHPHQLQLFAIRPSYISRCDPSIETRNPGVDKAESLIIVACYTAVLLIRNKNNSTSTLTYARHKANVYQDYIAHNYHTTVIVISRRNSHSLLTSRNTSRPTNRTAAAAASIHHVISCEGLVRLLG